MYATTGGPNFGILVHSVHEKAHGTRSEVNVTIKCQKESVLCLKRDFSKRVSTIVTACIYLFTLTDTAMLISELTRFDSFYFFSTELKGTIRHIAWSHLSSFLFKIQCFYRDKNYLDPNDKHYIGRKRNTLCLATFLKNDNSSCLLYTSSFN